MRVLKVAGPASRRASQVESRSSSAQAERSGAWASSGARRGRKRTVVTRLGARLAVSRVGCMADRWDCTQVNPASGPRGRGWPRVFVWGQAS